MADALKTIAPLADPATLIVSIAAGVRLEKLQAAFTPNQPIVRAMPNTPAQLGQGMTVAVANPHVAKADRTVDRRAARGDRKDRLGRRRSPDRRRHRRLRLRPGLRLPARRMPGRSRPQGRPPRRPRRNPRPPDRRGAGALLSDSPLPASKLRENVTSPKGTTAAALVRADGAMTACSRSWTAPSTRRRSDRSSSVNRPGASAWPSPL